MFTNNYIALKNARFYGNVNQNFVLANNTTKSLNVTAVHYGDLGFKLYNARYVEYDSAASGAGMTAGVAFGTGTTPPTRADYKLENQVPSGSLSFTNNSESVAAEDGGQWSAVASYIVKNTTDSDISISEIGYFGEVNTGSSTSGKFYSCLMERTVLAEPITIPAGQAKVITYKVSGVLSLS